MLHAATGRIFTETLQVDERKGGASSRDTEGCWVKEEEADRQRLTAKVEHSQVKMT